MAKKRGVSPLKGRKVDKESRGEDAPKLGRPFIHESPAKKYVISVSVPEEVMEAFLEKQGTPNKGTAIRKMIEEAIEEAVD